jgi:hypothetical protein
MVSAMSAEDAFLDFFAGFCVTISSSSDLLVPLAEVLKTLMRGYKSVKYNNKKYGAGKKSYEFETELDELFENDPIV